MTPEQRARRAQYSQEWEAQHRDERLEYHRQHYAANAEQKREYARQYRQEHPERVREAKKRSRRKNPQPNRDRVREWQQENPERYRETQNRNKRKMRARGYREPKVLERDQVIASYWHAQGGCCYLCGKPVPLPEAVLEHDHRCCPNGKYCSYCVRGAAHTSCNAAIGLASDDPDLLETLARNLRVKLAEIDERLASKPQQPTLDDVA